MAKAKDRLRSRRTATTAVDASLKSYEPPAMLDLIGKHVSGDTSRLHYGNDVSMEVTGRVVEESEETYVPPSQRKKRLRVQVRAIRVKGRKGKA